MAAASFSESATASAAGGVVKTETPDFETTPQTAHEAVVLHQLRQMGFPVQDTAEILAAYRQLHDEHSSSQEDGSSSSAAAAVVAPTADDVLLLAVGQRERHAGERLLAADMDRARLASERSRDDAAQRRAQIQQDRERQLERDSLASWMAQAFVHSWILHENNSNNNNVFQPYISQGPPTPLKRRLLKLLQLERSARQWYQERLPRAYFVHVVLDRLRKASTCPTALLQQVDTEIHLLECGMYELQRQVGGVPIIFRDALDANPDDDENRDEDVLLIQTMDRGSSASPWLAATTLSPSKKSSKTTCPYSAPKPVEVIELL